MDYRNSPQNEMKAQQAGTALSHARNTMETPVEACLSGCSTLIFQQAAELRNRVRDAAAQICGSAPSVNEAKPVEQPNSTIQILQLASSVLGEALLEIERLQGRL